MAKEAKSSIPPEVQERIDFAKSVVPKHKDNRLAKSIFAVIVVVLVILLLGLIIGSSGHTSKRSNVNNKAGTPQVVTLNTATPRASYTSKFFSLSLTYPKTWILKDSGQGLLAITSPLTKLIAANGSKVSGKVTFEIAKKGTTLPSKATAGTSLAVLDSSVVAYTNPSTDQSAQTYISFVQYSSTNTKGGLDGIYVTGNYGYQKDQVVSMTDISNIDPLVMVTFDKCLSRECKSFMPLTIASSSWSGSPLAQIITSIIKTFVFS